MRAKVLDRLLEIAGDLPRHIEMQPKGDWKYQWRRGSVTRELLEQHLAGEITLGTELRNRDGLTYAVCWDADNPDDWRKLLLAGRKLLKSGASPVAGRSPSRGKHAGGGHLWIFFSGPVSAGAAWSTAIKHAPELARFPEYWPGRYAVGPDTVGQAVRLPGGYYQREGSRGWCEYAAFGPDHEPRKGEEAAALALTCLTPTVWVTEPAPPIAQDLPLTPSPELDTDPIDPDAEHPPPLAARNPDWITRYGKKRQYLRYWITNEQAVEWYNATHDIRQLLPKERNGYACAVWRGERTSSVGYLANNAWVDYGAGGRRPDGRRDGGDALDAYCRLEGLTKDQALAQIVADMVREADRELELAARNYIGLPAWVAAVTSPTGWRRYRELAQQRARK